MCVYNRVLRCNSYFCLVNSIIMKSFKSAKCFISTSQPLLNIFSNTMLLPCNIHHCIFLEDFCWLSVEKQEKFSIRTEIGYQTNICLVYKNEVVQTQNIDEYKTVRQPYKHPEVPLSIKQPKRKRIYSSYPYTAHKHPESWRLSSF